MAKNEEANAINELAYRYYLGKDISKDEKKRHLNSGKGK